VNFTLPHDRLKVRPLSICNPKRIFFRLIYWSSKNCPCRHTAVAPLLKQNFPTDFPMFSLLDLDRRSYFFTYVEILEAVREPFVNALNFLGTLQNMTVFIP
jgi:hypothetical protein